MIIRTYSCNRSMLFCQTTVVVLSFIGILLYPEPTYGFSSPLSLTLSKSSPSLSPLRGSTNIYHDGRNNRHNVDDNFATTNVRVMTYNIHAWRDSNHKCNFDRVVDVIQQVQPDIVCLNEVLHPFAATKNEDDTLKQQQKQYYYDLVQSGKAKGIQIASDLIVPSDKSFLHLLSQKTDLPHYDYFGATDDSYFGLGVSFGNAILSRFPFKDQHHILLEPEDGDIHLGNQERSFVDPRAFSIATVSLSNNTADLGICYTHLDHKSEELREKQISQGLTAAFSKLNNMRNIPRVICGDLNTFQESDCSLESWHAILDLYETNQWSSPPEKSLALDMLKKWGFRDAFYEVNNSDTNSNDDVHGSNYPDPTCWTHKPLMRIDHMWIGDDDGNLSPPFKKHGSSMIVKNYERFESMASDHFPVWIDLEIS